MVEEDSRFFKGFLGKIGLPPIYTKTTRRREGAGAGAGGLISHEV